jgi:hypothetical protein
MNKLDDAVYMPDEEKRREYVLNDVGKIYIGSHSKPKGRQWIYGQVGSFNLIKTSFIALESDTVYDTVYK